MRARRHFGGHSPGTERPRAAKADLVEYLVAVSDGVYQPCLTVEPGVGGEQSGRVGQHHQQGGTDQVSHQGSQPVVVAEPKLVERHGVVLVDHGYDLAAHHPLQGALRMEVLTAVGENLAGQEHLPGDPPNPIELGGVPLHEARLSHRCRHLECRRIVGPVRPAEGGYSHRHRPRSHQHRGVASAPGVGDTIDYTTQRCRVETGPGRRQAG